GCLCGVLQYASAQPLDLLDLDKKSSFLNWKLASARKTFLDGHDPSRSAVLTVNQKAVSFTPRR
ncbi:MAG: hypothetical protein ACQET7_05650, partial [Thermodesulfobacteriota bacterium]